MIRLSAPNGSLSLTVHASLWKGLAEEAGFYADRAPGPDTADALMAYASTLPTHSQRGMLARAVAELVYMNGQLFLEKPSAAAHGFWEAVG